LKDLGQVQKNDPQSATFNTKTIYIQVIKISNATKMYTKDGLEVRSFSQLRNIFSGEETFVLSPFPTKVRLQSPELTWERRKSEPNLNQQSVPHLSIPYALQRHRIPSRYIEICFF